MWYYRCRYTCSISWISLGWKRFFDASRLTWFFNSESFSRLLFNLIPLFIRLNKVPAYWVNIQIVLFCHIYLMNQILSQFETILFMLLIFLFFDYWIRIVNLLLLLRSLTFALLWALSLQIIFRWSHLIWSFWWRWNRPCFWHWCIFEDCW